MDELAMHDPGRPRNLLKPCAVSPTACDMNTVKLGLQLAMRTPHSFFKIYRQAGMTKDVVCQHMQKVEIYTLVTGESRQKQHTEQA